MGDLLDLVKLPFKLVAFLVDSCLGLLATAATLLTLICCLGWLVECGPSAAKVADDMIEKGSSSDSEGTK